MHPGEITFTIHGRPPVPPEPIVQDVTRCARCCEGHPAVTFTPLTRQIAILGATHWAPCPANGEPILLREGQH